MKIIYYTILFIFTINMLFAQDLSGIKICLDPGHGKYPQDKPYEARINIRVAKYLKNYLNDYGADVLLTHEDTTAVLGLYDRDQIANSFNADFFQSIHHNAYNAQSNYTMVLYSKNYSGIHKDDNILMCNIMSPLIYDALYTTSYKVYADYDLVGFNYGVLKYLNMKGVLSEASFWDYYDEIMRLNSEKYLKLEAKAIFYSYLKFYNQPRPSSSTIFGQITDEFGNCMKNVKVTIYNATDTMEFITDTNNIGITDDDNNWWQSLVGFIPNDSVKNGFYFFENFPAGQAIIKIEKEGFQSIAETVDVVDTAFTQVDFQNVRNLSPTTLTYTLSANADINNMQKGNYFIFSFTRKMSKNDTEKAIYFDPPLDSVKLKWAYAFKMLKVYPIKYQYDTDYKLIIDGSIAKDYNGNLIDPDNDGIAGDSLIINFHTITGTRINEHQESTTKQINIKVYPNPFNNIINISINNIANKNIDISIYDITGRFVKSIYNGIAKDNKCNFIWNGYDNKKNKLSNGIYLLVLKINRQKTLTEKIILLK